MLCAARRAPAALCFLCSVLLSLTGALHAQAPQITGVNPPSGIPGTQVTLTGINFGASQGSGSVVLAGKVVTIVSWANTQIVATVASGSLSGFAVVQQGGVSSNGVPFNMSPPVLTSATPGSGVPGTQVTLVGTGFGSAQGSGGVGLGNKSATIVSWSDTQIVATVAAGSIAGYAGVQQNGVTSNQIPFAMDHPNITSVNPTSGTSGTQVTVSGTGFGAAQGTGSLVLGTQNGSIVSWSDTQIVATVASGSTAGWAYLQQNLAYSNEVERHAGFQYARASERRLSFCRSVERSVTLTSPRSSPGPFA